MKTLLVLVALWLPMGCSSSSNDPADQSPGSGIQFDALAQRENASVVVITVTATNASEQRQQVELLGGGCTVRKVVWRGTEDVPIVDDRDSDLPCQQISTLVDLGPGEVLALGDEPYRFDLAEEVGEGFAPGDYRVAALLRTGGDFVLVPAGTVDLD